MGKTIRQEVAWMVNNDRSQVDDVFAIFRISKLPVCTRNEMGQYPTTSEVIDIDIHLSTCRCDVPDKTKSCFI
jgi:hypothetical protein